MKNLRDMLGKDYTKERVDKMMKEADENNDGKISFQEFLKAFRRNEDSIRNTTLNVVI